MTTFFFLGKEESKFQLAVAPTFNGRRGGAGGPNHGYYIFPVSDGCLLSWTTGRGGVGVGGRFAKCDQSIKFFQHIVYKFLQILVASVLRFHPIVLYLNK